MHSLIHIFSISIIIALISINYNKKFILSIIINLEMIILNIFLINLLLPFYNNELNFNIFSLFILTLSAVEASIGISLMTLIARNNNNNNINNLNLLKN